MLFAYIDDFGHVGPYVGRSDPQHNTSPVYGFAGFVLPASEIRNFSSFFLQLKENNLKGDAEKAQKPIFKWEKKGTNLFTRNSIVRYRAVREMGFRLLGEVNKRGGSVFYCGREKVRGADAGSPVGLQKTLLTKAIRRLDRGASQAGQNFALVMDQCSARLELLESAQKTMFGERPCRQLVSPPFEVESHLSQSMQAADWIATLVGRVWAWRLDPEGFADYEPYEKYYGERLGRSSAYSTVTRRTDVPRNYVVRGGGSATLIEQKTTETIVVTPGAMSATVTQETTTVSLHRHRGTRSPDRAAEKKT